jgi:hypothetical protein
MRAWRSSFDGAALLLGCLTVTLPALLGCGAQQAPPSALAEQNARRVLWPVRLGWVSSERPSGALPSAISLGGKASGRVLIYLEFAAPSELRRLLRADLVLVASGAPGESIEVELSRAEPARGELAAWSDQPRARYPRRSARLAGGALPGRLDVTELVRAESDPGQPLRLLLRAEPDANEPLLVETGAAGGTAPRLEAYWE